jgi:hypothetical protein
MEAITSDSLRWQTHLPWVLVEDVHARHVGSAGAPATGVAARAPACVCTGVRCGFDAISWPGRRAGHDYPMATGLLARRRPSSRLQGATW